MRVGLYTDNTLPLALEPLCQLLNSTCEKITFAVGGERFRINTPSVSNPSSYEQLPKKLVAETEKYDLAILCTTVPYDNNAFFDAERPIVIVSFNGWNLLTDLPVSNGLVYFVASVVGDELGLDNIHDNNTGCLNDFLWDKSGVDLGMRAAFICGDCLNSYEDKHKIVPDINRLLDLVSSASRAGKDVLNMLPILPGESRQVFDVFLCHNSVDKPIVRRLNEAFSSAGIKTWLDEEQLAPGVPWQPELEKQIGSVRAACVFVGKSGVGPWQDAELRAFLSEFVSRGCPVIPVILPNTREVPELPIFLKQMTWVDLRKQYESNLIKLIKALSRK